jgi:hypothetical protein
LLLRDCLGRPSLLFVLSFGMLQLLPRLGNFWLYVLLVGAVSLVSLLLAMVFRVVSTEDLPARLQRLFR